MTEAHRALLAHLRWAIEETPRSNALDSGGHAYRPRRFASAIDRRDEDGEALVSYLRKMVQRAGTEGFDPLIAVGRPDLTVEAVVADPDAPWAELFDEGDRAAARARLSQFEEAIDSRRARAEAEAVEHDRMIVDRVGESRLNKGKPALTEDQKNEMLARMAAECAQKPG